MRIDPNATIGGYPAPMVRKLIRRSRNWMFWDVETVQKAAALNSHQARALITALRRRGLVESNPERNRGTWRTTQLGQAFGSAAMAKPIMRRTAERALAEFLKRVHRVNADAYFLAKVTKVILFGSMLRGGVNQLSDVDVAVQLEPKQLDREGGRMLNNKRVAALARKGRRFDGFLERELCWHVETFRFLKGRSRAIALVDYNVEKPFIDKVPHQFLVGQADRNPAPAPSAIKHGSRPPKDCPF
jgi:predicted nucleotidyltransferase